ncbi:MAG TPA: hypothetical protein VNP04_02770 [Alphaproteobacteria bacterium]|nr:hypothetical protein [Alphaproteobacteria bacterium]
MALRQGMVAEIQLVEFVKCKGLDAEVGGADRAPEELSAFGLAQV